MAKRMTDTNKWKKAFIKNLPLEYKLFWVYLLDECDHAGIWHVEIDVASARLGCNLEIMKAVELFEDSIFVFDSGEKWFIPAFIEFQYGELNYENRAHNSVISLLKKYNLYKPLTSPLQGTKDKEQDKDIVKDREKEFKEAVKKFNSPHEKEFIEYWTEPNKSGTKMRFEMERTWDLKRRLSRWSSNNFGNKETIKPQKPKRSSNFERIQGIDYNDPKFKSNRQ